MKRNKNYFDDKKWKFKEYKSSSFKSKRISKVILEILSNRNISNEKQALDFLYPKFEKLSNPFLLPEMNDAVKIILNAIDLNDKIAIYGDYDVDGISATALLQTFFSEIGVDVLTYIPSRTDEGYGINTNAIDTLLAESVKLIITVDCGSTSFKEIKYAKEKGLKVIVTDHHSLKEGSSGYELPDTDALINPKLLEQDSPFYELAGVGVAFYLVRALQTKLTDKFALGQEKWLLDLVALGTICDVVPLTKDNRILAKFGLLVLSKSKRTGLVELAKCSGFDLSSVDTYKVGFLLGPRLNAAGRMEHASTSLKLMLSKEENESKKFALKLDELNSYRQEMTEKIVEEARGIISGLDGERKIYLISGKNWPSGVLGIVASRLVEEYGKPMLIMEENGEGFRGSARSIKNFNILNALADCSEYFVHFGGHSAAAGFSFKKEHFVVLDRKLIKISNEKITEEDLKQELFIDSRIEISDIDDKLMTELRLLEPFGRENPKPVFCLNNINLINYRFVGNQNNHLKLTASKDNKVINGIAFNFGADYPYKQNEVFDLAVTLEENEWANQKKKEIRVIDIKTV